MESKRRELNSITYKKMFNEIIPEFRDNKIIFHLSLSAKKVSVELLDYGDFEIDRDNNHAWKFHQNYNLIIEIWYAEEVMEVK